MDSLNAFLLSTFTKNERYGQDVSSLYRRYQSLSIIYVNLGMNILMISYNIISTMFFHNPQPYLMFLVCLPLSISSFYFLRTKNLFFATLTMLIEMHASCLIASYTTNCPLVVIYSIILYPFFIFSLTSSLALHLLNAVFCGYEYYYNISRVMKIFEVTLTDEQHRQIILYISGGLMCCAGVILISILQKAVESNIWKIAQENYTKSENLTKEVVQAMEAKDTFVSMLSHEIRNPLNSLKGSIDYLLQVVKNYDHIQVLKNAKLSGDILLNLVCNVLDAAKLKSEKMEINCTETDVVDIVKKVYTINSEKFKEKEIVAKAYIDQQVPDLLWIDPSRILQIIMNLVSNAVKFTPLKGRIQIYVSWCHPQEKREKLLSLFENIGPDGAPEGRSRRTEPTTLCGDTSIFDEFLEEDKENHQRKISSIKRVSLKGANDLSTLPNLGMELAGEYWSVHRTKFLSEVESPSLLNSNEIENSNNNKGFLKIQITDNGCGISEGDLPKIFGMFEQARHGSRLVHGGTGLGLWICKQLCLKMNGDIIVSSQFGRGSSFVLYIPVDNNRVNAQILPRLNNNNNNNNANNRERLRALVVDDYSMNRYLHKLLLEQEGVETVVACNGKEAVEKYISQADDAFGFIMMDVQMPEMDGFTAAKLIRDWETENNKEKVDIYFVTGEYFNEEETMATFRNKGGRSEGIRFARKPLGGENINKIVSNYKGQ